jgi:hypothetical protein
MRTVAFFLGATAQGLHMLRPRLGWRQWQRARVWLIHARDISVCLAAILAWGIVVMAFA